MKITGAEAAELVADMTKEVPSLEPLARNLPAIIGRVFDEAGTYNKNLEDRIAESGKVPGDVVVALMMHGAMTEILDGLPEGNARRELVKAGRIVGKFMARKFREKIGETLTKQMGDN